MARSTNKLSVATLSTAIVYLTETVEGKEVTTGIDLVKSEERFRDMIQAYNEGRSVISVKGSGISQALVAKEFAKIVGNTLVQADFVRAMVTHNIVTRLTADAQEAAELAKMEAQEAGLEYTGKVEEVSNAEVKAAVELFWDSTVQLHGKDFSLGEATQYIVFKGKGGGVVNLSGGLTEIARRKA